MIIEGIKELERALNELNSRARGETLEAAGIAGALPILNRAKELARKDTTTMARAIHIGGHTELSPEFGPSETEPYEDIGQGKISQSSAVIQVGLKIVYGAAHEFGTDKISAKPFLRPALDEMRGEAINETAEALKDILLR